MPGPIGGAAGGIQLHYIGLDGTASGRVKHHAELGVGCECHQVVGELHQMELDGVVPGHYRPGSLVRRLGLRLPANAPNRCMSVGGPSFAVGPFKMATVPTRCAQGLG